MYDNSTIDKIIELGGREWVSKDFSRHRIYFGYSFIYEAINLKLGHYDSAGNYIGAALKENAIAPSFAEHLKAIISHMCLYYDLNKGTFEINDTYQNMNRFRWIFNETIEYINTNAS